VELVLAVIIGIGDGSDYANSKLVGAYDIIRVKLGTVGVVATYLVRDIAL